MTSSDVFSAVNNQAGLAMTDSNISVGTFTERRFILNELSTHAISTVIPTQYGGIGVAAQYSGFQNFGQTKTGVGFGKKLANNFAIGVQANYHNLRISENGNQGYMTVEAGLLTDISDNIVLGAHVYNPFRPEIAENENTPSNFRLGITYHELDQYRINAEVEKNIFEDPILKFGLEYRPVEQVFLRGGVNTQQSLSFGLGAILSGFQLDISYSIHQELGASPGVSLTYHFGEQ